MLNDSHIHKTQKFVIKNSMNIICSNNKYVTYYINLSTNHFDNTYLEIRNLSKVNPIYKIKSNFKIQNVNNVQNNIYIIEAPKVLKLILHDNEWKIINN